MQHWFGSFRLERALDTQDFELTPPHKLSRWISNSSFAPPTNALHRRHLINYIQWTSPEKLKAAHQAPEFRKKWPQFDEMTEEIDPCLYEVVFTEAA